MDVRLARPTDAPLVLSLSLDAGAHLVRSYGWPAVNPAPRTVLRAWLPLAPRGRLWIARNERTAALLEAEPRQYVIGWDVTRLAARGEGVEEAVAAAVNAATEHLRCRGVPRLFARCGQDGCTYLRPLGFHPLAREYVLLGPDRPPSDDESPPLDSRYRMPQDDWPLHQLESQVTPPLVRQLEGLSSLDWSRPVRKMSEIVIERDGKVIAWVGWGKRLAPKHRNIAMLIHPDHIELARALLGQAMRQAGDGCRLVTRVRDYHLETLRAFTDAGFTVVAEDVILVKHGAVEMAPVQKSRLAVQAVPSVQGFPIRLHPVALAPSITHKEDLT
jgi:hypothetical protein